VENPRRSVKEKKKGNNGMGKREELIEEKIKRNGALCSVAAI
jgi:hypothetical protein